MYRNDLNLQKNHTKTAIVTGKKRKNSSEWGKMTGIRLKYYKNMIYSGRGR